MSNAEEFDLDHWRANLRKGDPVEVKNAKWSGSKSGKVKDYGRGGYFVKTGDGHSGFYHMKEIFPTASVVTIQKSPDTTLGAALKAKGTDLRLITTPPPRHERAPLTMLPGMVRVVEKGQAKGLVVGQTSKALFDELEETKMISRPVRKVRRRSRGRHHLTQIGHIIRRERLKRSMGQEEFAVLIKVAGGRIVGRFELGVQMPSDDVLITMVEVLGLELGDLLAARDGYVTPEPASEPMPIVSIPTKEQAPEPEPEEEEPVITSNQSTQEPKSTDNVDWFIAALEFTERMKAAIPFPEKLDARRAWYKTVLAMFETYQKSNGN